jgi:hypothetical protein
MFEMVSMPGVGDHPERDRQQEVRVQVGADAEVTFRGQAGVAPSTSTAPTTRAAPASGSPRTPSAMFTPADPARPTTLKHCQDRDDLGARE